MIIVGTNIINDKLIKYVKEGQYSGNTLLIEYTDGSQSLHKDITVKDIVEAIKTRF